MNNPSIIQFKATRSSVTNPLPLLPPRWRGRVLFIILVALSNLATIAQVKAVDTTDTFYGTGAFNATSTGVHDSAFGYSALFYNTTGSNNTANGAFALGFNHTGNGNTASGVSALANNFSGAENVANGESALGLNMTGSQNTATGASALLGNSTASNNTADGFQALFHNTTGTQNTGSGAFALRNNNANNNTADGFQALLNNATGEENTAVGESAFKFSNTDSNTGVGFQVAFHTTTGMRNTAIGHHALLNNSTGSSNIALGASAGLNLTTGSDNIDIGSVGGGGESNTIRIGSVQTRTFIKGISGVAVSGAAVVVNAGGQLGMTASSARFKNEITPMNRASEAILALKPVTFRYKQEIDPEKTPQFGLVAEEVEKVNPDLVVRDQQGVAYSVRYDAVNAMLLNEFLKEHRKVEDLKNDFEATVAQQQKEISALTAALKKQAAQIQKVSCQIELSKASPRTVQNDR